MDGSPITFCYDNPPKMTADRMIGVFACDGLLEGSSVVPVLIVQS